MKQQSEKGKQWLVGWLVGLAWAVLGLFGLVLATCLRSPLFFVSLSWLLVLFFFCFVCFVESVCIVQLPKLAAGDPAADLRLRVCTRVCTAPRRQAPTDASQRLVEICQNRCVCVHLCARVCFQDGEQKRKREEKEGNEYVCERNEPGMVKGGRASVFKTHNNTRNTPFVAGERVSEYVALACALMGIAILVWG